MEEKTEISDLNADSQSQKESIQCLFGRNVKLYRKRAGLTQEQLSERLGVSQKHLSIIETGTQFASAGLIGRISEELRVSPGDLFGGSSDDIIEEIRKSQSFLMSMMRNEMNRYYAILSNEITELRKMIKNQMSDEDYGFSEI